MEYPSNQSGAGQQGGTYHHAAPRNLPNSNLILILGILSILLCWWHFISIAGIILGIISLVMAKKENALYMADPASYTTSSLNNVKTGRICAVIGLTISIIVFVFVILMIIGVLVTLPFWGMMH
jgi:hypothetical protein